MPLPPAGCVIPINNESNPCVPWTDDLHSCYFPYVVVSDIGCGGPVIWKTPNNDGKSWNKLPSALNWTTWTYELIGTPFFFVNQDGHIVAFYNTSLNPPDSWVDFIPASTFSWYSGKLTLLTQIAAGGRLGLFYMDSSTHSFCYATTNGFVIGSPGQAWYSSGNVIQTDASMGGSYTDRKVLAITYDNNHNAHVIYCYNPTGLASGNTVAYICLEGATNFPAAPNDTLHGPTVLSTGVPNSSYGNMWVSQDGASPNTLRLNIAVTNWDIATSGVSSAGVLVGTAITSPITPLTWAYTAVATYPTTGADPYHVNVAFVNDGSNTGNFRQLVWSGVHQTSQTCDVWITMLDSSDGSIPPPLPHQYVDFTQVGPPAPLVPQTGSTWICDGLVWHKYVTQNVCGVPYVGLMVSLDTKLANGTTGRMAYFIVCCVPPLHNNYIAIGNRLESSTLRYIV